MGPTDGQLSLFDLADVHAAEPMAKVAAAAPRFTLRAVTQPDSAAFDEAYRAMDAFFGPRGEIERRETLQGLVREPDRVGHDGLQIHYHLVTAHDENGDLAGARDCFVTVSEARRVCLVFLSHALVLPAYRRTGLAVILRSMPATLGRAAIKETFGADRAADLLLAAEMEPVDPTDPDTVVRLLAYGRSGFSVIAPDHLPYLQPDFRDLAALGVPARPIPLMPVVRWVGNEDRVEVPNRLAMAFDRHIHGVHGLFVDAAQMQVLCGHAEGALGARDPVPMVRIPAMGAPLIGLAPLLRSVVLPLYPPELQGQGKGPGDPAAEREALASMVLRAPGTPV